METGLILRLRQVLALFEARLRALARALGRLAGTHADAADGGAHLWPGGDADQFRRRGAPAGARR